MSNKITYYESVLDVYKELGLTAGEDVGFIINDLNELIQNFPYQSKVYRANYYSFLFIKKGEGEYVMDDQTFHYGSNTVYFANPGHIKSHTFEYLEDAYRIALTEDFLRTYVHPEIFSEFSFLLAEIVPPQTTSDEVFREFRDLYMQIQVEFHKSSFLKYRIIGNLFAVILLKIKEQFWKNYIPIEEGNRSSQIVKTFKKNIEDHYIDLSKGKIESLFGVNDYASTQNLNPNYFNQVIKSKTGKSVSSWIAEKSLIQAKAMLKHSPKSIKEIAFLLGYAELSHFSNFFKKHMQTSPSAYRKANK